MSLFRFVKRKLVARCPNLVAQKGALEPKESVEIGEYLANNSVFVNASVFVDGGANTGYYVCLARRLGDTRRGDIEPHRGNLDSLRANLGANDWFDVEVFPAGVGKARVSGFSTVEGQMRR